MLINAAGRTSAVFALVSTLIYGEDFSLRQNGSGPINVHTQITYEGKGERLIATATNDSGESISYLKLCVKAQSKGCLFEMWTNLPWEAGGALNFDLTSSRHVSNLSHEVTIEALNLSGLVQKPAVNMTAIPMPAVQPKSSIPNSIPPPVRRPALNNEGILKLVRAGLSDEVIVALIGSQPGEYSLDSDSVIAMKQSGVSDKILSAILSRNMMPAEVVRAARQVSTETLILHDGTPVRLRLARNLSSADARTGDTIDFEVLDDIEEHDILLVHRGAVANGTITDAEAKKRMARGGKLDVTIDYVRLVNGEKVALRGSKDTSGGGHAGAMTGAIVATAFVVWPAAPFFLFMHGKDSVMPKGTEITAYVNGDIKIDRATLPAR